MTQLRSSRRCFLTQAAGFAAASAIRPSHADEPTADRKPLRIATINSEYRYLSHAYHIGRRFMEGYDREGVRHQPRGRIVRMLNDKHPPNDLGPADAARCGFELCDTVEATLGGPGKLDVDAVLLIIEHGDYPVNELGQVLYPRHEYFMQIVKQFEAVGHSVPVFVDKHLSYDARKAHEMVAAARRLKFPMSAGSSLPVTWRIPELELPLETPVTEALVAFGFGNAPTEIYHFHALETLQCMMERRRGGETGVRRVTMLTGDEVWKAGDDGRWSWDLLNTALARSWTLNVGDVRLNARSPEVILVEYADGTRGAALNLFEHVADFTFAARREGRREPVSTCCYLPAPPGAKFFDALVWNIEKLFDTGNPPYPVERTLLTSVMLDFAMHSRKAGGAPQTSELLDVRYQAPADGGFLRGHVTRDG